MNAYETVNELTRLAQAARLAAVAVNARAGRAYATALATALVMAR